MTRVGDLPLIIDYSLCNQAVTIYRFDGDDVTYTHYPKAYFEYVDKGELERTGESGKTEHLIVIPGNEIECKPGDKVYLGEGEEPQYGATSAAKWWREFIPAKVDNLAVIRSVSPRYWRGEIVHYELRG